MSEDGQAGVEVHGQSVAELAGDPTVFDDPSIDVLQRVLLITDGYVVRLLEACYGETVRTAAREQFTAPLPAGEAELEPTGGETVLRRTVLLRGIRSGRFYVAAESSVVLDRLDPRMADKLLHTDEPIGRLLATFRVETFRDFREVGRARAGTLGPWFGIDGDEELLFRKYRMISGGRPITLITEYFPRQSLTAEWSAPAGTWAGSG